MMGTKARRFSPLPPDLSLEGLVPNDHFYRRLEECIDLYFVRDLVAPLYAGGGRPSIDPVVFFKLQLVMFFEDLRSERQLMRVVADRISLRWYLGYDLHEPLPDHSSLTRIRERYGLEVFRSFFERIVEICAEAGLVRGQELFFDATKVEADAALDSLAPRWFVESHLRGLFEEDADEYEKGSEDAPDAESVRSLPTVEDDDLARTNRATRDWISRKGAQDRSFKGTPWRERTADTRASRTDPDASPMRWSGNARRLGYQTHYVVDGGKARIVLSVLVTPGEVTENRPMLDLLWRTCFRWKLRPHHVTGDGKYGTVENIKAVEESGIRAYLGLHEAGGRGSGFFPKSEFAYDPEKDRYLCPAGETLRALGDAERQPQTRQDRHLPGERFGLRRLLPQAAMHHQQEWPVPEARSRGRIYRAGQSVHGDGAVPQSHTQAQGVDRAAVRGGEALAPDAPVPDEDFREDQHRGATDRRRAEREAAACLRTDKPEGSSAGSSAQVVRKAAFKSDPGPSHGSSARFSTGWSVYGTSIERR